MVGSHAGCHHCDRVPAYLSNLFGLGLIWFLREPIDDLSTPDHQAEQAVGTRREPGPQAPPAVEDPRACTGDEGFGEFPSNINGKSPNPPHRALPGELDETVTGRHG